MAFLAEDTLWRELLSEVYLSTIHLLHLLKLNIVGAVGVDVLVGKGLSAESTNHLVLLQL